jgi:hypothetical protein
MGGWCKRKGEVGVGSEVPQDRNERLSLAGASSSKSGDEKTKKHASLTTTTPQTLPPHPTSTPTGQHGRKQRARMGKGMPFQDRTVTDPTSVGGGRVTNTTRGEGAPSSMSLFHCARPKKKNASGARAAQKSARNTRRSRVEINFMAAAKSWHREVLNPQGA